jgi:hypothetical protein
VAGKKLKRMIEYIKSLWLKFQTQTNFNIDVYYTIDQPWAIVGEVDREINSTKVIIPQHEWAPGLWAGVNYITLDFKDPETGLTMARADAYEIDMETRTIYIVCNTDLGIIKSGYTIHPRWEHGI